MSIRRSRVVWIPAAVLFMVVAGVALVQLSSAPNTTAAIDPATASAPQQPAEPTTPGSEPPTGTPPTLSTPAPTPDEGARGDETLATGPSTLPPSEPPPDLIGLPFPENASAVGKLVAGFPIGIVPEAPDSTVASSSVTSEGGRLQIALSADSTLDVVDVLDFYRTELAKVGLLDTPAPALSGSSALEFVRGDHTVTLSATTVRGGCRYVVLGSFTAPS